MILPVLGKIVLILVDLVTYVALISLGFHFGAVLPLIMFLVLNFWHHNPTIRALDRLDILSQVDHV